MSGDATMPDDPWEGLVDEAGTPTEPPAEGEFEAPQLRVVREPERLAVCSGSPMCGRCENCAAAREIDEEGKTAFSRTILRRSQLQGLPPVEPLIDGVLSLRGTVMLIGPSGAGKTFLSLAWACAIGTGTPWLGHPVKRMGVLYVVGEGAAGIDDRVTAWEKAWKANVGDDDVIFSIRPATLSHPIVWAEIAAEAKALDRRFVVLDTFSSLAPDADETKDAAVLTRRMADLAAAIDGTVMLVHHPGWGDATRARGGSQLEANVDEVVILHGNRTDPNIALELKKRKDGVSGAKQWMRRKPAHGSVIIEMVSDAQRDQEAALSAGQSLWQVHGDDKLTKTQMRDTLMERLNVSQSTAYEHITRMERDKTLKYAGGKGRAATYQVQLKE